MVAVKRRLRDALRPDERRRRLDRPVADARGDRAAARRRRRRREALLFEWSMVEMVERYLSDERLQLAYLGQGVIGTNASPHDPGTASIYYHHASGRMGGMPGTWGYVQGGMGMVSFILCDIAREAGAVVAAGVPVARIVPGEGVELESGERIHAPRVVSNADPRVTLRLLDGSADAAWAARVMEIPIDGVHGQGEHDAAPSCPTSPPARARWSRTTRGRRTRRCRRTSGGAHHRAANEGDAAAAAVDRALHADGIRRERGAPGDHTLSVFAQYVPTRFTEGTGTRGGGGGRWCVGSIARFCSNLPGSDRRDGGAGPAGHRAAGRPHRRADLPGRDPAGNTCGIAGWRPGRRCRVSISAARAPIPAGA